MSTWFDPDEDENAGELSNLTILKGTQPFRITRGKYAGLVLPRMLGTKPAYQEKVDALKLQIITDPEFKMHASALSREYAAIRREKQEAKEALSEVELRLEAVSQLMAEQFENEDQSSMTSKETGDNVRVQPEPHAVIVDPGAFRVWCLRDPDLALKMKLPWPTANSLAKERMLATLPEPDGVKLYMRNKVVFKKGS